MARGRCGDSAGFTFLRLVATRRGQRHQDDAEREEQHRSVREAQEREVREEVAAGVPGGHRPCRCDAEHHKGEDRGICEGALRDEEDQLRGRAAATHAQAQTFVTSSL